MTFFLQHKACMLVVFAMTAMIGLSSCADTITGSEILKSEDAVQETATYNTYQKGRVLPTPGDNLSQLGATADQAAQGVGSQDGPALQADWEQLPDSSSTSDVKHGGPTRQGQKMADRF